jgi:SDR family mycofactocin-dependent oxidoreductase
VTTGTPVPLPGRERPVAVVTGAARGIGAAVAEGLAAAGWDLVLGDVERADAVPGLSYALADPADLREVAGRCEELGAHVVAAACDVRDGEQVVALVDAAGAALRAAVSVAGIMGSDGPAWRQTTADLDLDLSVNLHGVANLARAAVPRLLDSADPTRCRFVAVISSAAVRGLPLLASYVASKHAALGYLRALAADLAPAGVTANAVLPGSTRTALLARTARAYDLASPEAFAANQRLGRLIEPSEIAAAVTWLCSAGASAVTGAAVSVDAAFTG